MDQLKPLPLIGTALDCVGLPQNCDRSVLRLRSLEREPDKDACDFAVVRNVSEYQQAKERGWSSIFFVCGHLEETSKVIDAESSRTVVVPAAQYDYLSDGDVLGLRHSSRRFRVLFRQNSKHNSFLVTERCNNYCLMCSQPPKNVDDGWILDEIRDSLPLIDPSTPFLTFTGGEPLTEWQRFLEVLQQCKAQLPSTAIQVLTNGRAFASSEIVDGWRAVAHSNLTAAIPVYSAVDHIHDYVVQAKGAFDETILGILKLADRGQRIEIRVVLHALTAPHIAQTCAWIARNLPFVNHVALMGLENTGFAIANEAALWIDPLDYQDALVEAVESLDSARVNVSIYNLPRCILSRSLWQYAVKSISDWKNGYVDECSRCAEIDECGGFFTSGRPRLSRGIRAIS